VGGAANDYEITVDGREWLTKVRPVISPEEFIGKGNVLLRRHKMYEEGMKIFLVRLGSNGKTAGGYAKSGPRDLQGIYKSVEDLVNSVYFVDPTISRG
jgi:hypothetical protein